VTLRLPSDTHTLALLGERDAHIRLIEEAFPDARIVARGDEVRLSGTEAGVRDARIVIEELIALVTAGHLLDEDRVRRSIHLVVADLARPTEVFGDGVAVGRGKVIRPKTLNQKHYVDAIRRNTVVFGIGPAGTGKTYLGMALAVAALHAGSVNRLVLTRPAVEAGERLGFLPGDMAAKVDPYLRPLYDALYEMLGPEETHRLMDRGTIEVAPLAYMRGRTLNDAFIILDEAQNTTSEQMKMFLTRLGFNSKMVVTGDITQVDLPASRPSGLIEVQTVLQGIDGIRFIYFDDRDVVRHDLVSSIVRAYDRIQKPSSLREDRAP
jgi:phosphate starvation-inducible PhoH-like protein